MEQLLSAHEDAGSFLADQRLKLFLEHGQPRAFACAGKVELRFRRQEQITASGQRVFLAIGLHGAIAGADVIKMFQRAGVARAGAGFIQRELQL